MNKKPVFDTSIKKRVIDAQRELENESEEEGEAIQTTVVLKANLLYAVKEIGLKRKRNGRKPYTVTGIIRDALETLVRTEKEK